MRSSTYLLGGWSVGSATAAGATAFSKLIPPNTLAYDPNVGQNLYSSVLGGLVPGSTTIHLPGWYGRVGSPSVGVTHITDLVYTTGATAHAISILQPCNWTYTTAASLKNVNT
jgi:hypothetical protein